MQNRILTLAALLLVGVLAACSSRLDFAAEVLSPKTTQDVVVIDGEAFSFVTYRTGGQPPLQTIYYIGGSGCASLRTYLGTYFSHAPAGLEIVALEKTGVRDRAIGTRCSGAFWEDYTYDDILRRNRIALSYQLRKSQSDALPIIGTSEGGAVALELAAHSNAVERLAIIGAGAMSQRRELQTLLGEAAANSALAPIESNPQSVELRVLGLPHRYWSSVLDRNPANYARQIDVPTVIIIGANDRNVPVASARLAHEMIRASQLIVWPDASHIFDTPTGNQRDRVVQAATAFLTAEPP